MTYLSVLAVLIGATSAPAFAEEPVVRPAVPSEMNIQPAPGTAPPPPAKPQKKGRRSGEKAEAEGTEALDRFEADTVIKSKYLLNGESLEVDPD